MNYDWITTAVENSGVMTLSQLKGKIRATMNWRGEESVYGEFSDTLPEAITSLNEELHNDAANEMIEAGAV